MRRVTRRPAVMPRRRQAAALQGAFGTQIFKAVAKVSQFSEDEFNRTVSCLLPGGEWKMPQPEAFWGNLMDEVHHRGQLTVYLRLAGGKVPSIYGPSRDEAPAFGAA